MPRFCLLIAALLVSASAFAPVSGKEPLLIGTSPSSGSNNAGTSAWQVNSAGNVVSPAGSVSGQQGYRLWIVQGSADAGSAYVKAALGSTVELKTYSPSGGPVKLCDVWESGIGITGIMSDLNLPAGNSQGTYQVTSPGVHTLWLAAGNSASNAVIVDVGTGAGSQGKWSVSGSTVASGSSAVSGSSGSSGSSGPSQPARTSGGSGSFGKDSGGLSESERIQGLTAVPLARVQAVGPTEITSPYDEVADTVTPEEGGEIKNAGASLSVPPGAVSTDTEIAVKRLTGEPPQGDIPESEAEQVVLISDAFDFGPDGIQFNKPVRITLSYQDDMLPEGSDESDIMFAYFDGRGWKATRGLVDAERNTASIELNEFPGIIIELILGTIIAGTAYVIGKKLAGHVEGDLITKGVANNYVTPSDPAVKAQSKRAVLKGTKTNEEMHLDDPLLGEMLDRNSGEADLIFVHDDGRRSKTRYPEEGELESGSYGKIKPKDFLTKLEPPSGDNPYWSNPGDCVDVTDAGVSLFLANDLPAKGVSGYQTLQDYDKKTKKNFVTKKPHAWGEVLIDNKAYLLDENGKIAPLESTMKRMNLERPSADDRRYRMWDDKSITKYDPDWFKKYMTTNSNLKVEQLGPYCCAGKDCVVLTTSSVPSAAKFQWSFDEGLDQEYDNSNDGGQVHNIWSTAGDHTAHLTVTAPGFYGEGTGTIRIESCKTWEDIARENQQNQQNQE